MADGPRVWPVVATRGRPEWAEKQIERLTGQLVDGERVVVIVDGDRPSEDRLAGWYGDPRVSMVALSAQAGVDTAKRLGVSLVPTDAVVCEIDDHDLAEPELLAELRAAFADADAMAAYCDVYHTDPAGQVRKTRTKVPGRFCATGNLGWGMRAYRRWVYDAVGGYPTDYWPANDYALMCMIEQLVTAYFAPGDSPGVSSANYPIRHIARALVTVVEDRHGISAQHKDQQQDQVVRVANLGLRSAFALPYRLWSGNGHARAADVSAPPAPTPAPPVPAPATPPPAAVGHVERAGGGVEGVAPRREIPKLIHFVWVGPEIPDWARANIDRFRRLNPGYLVLVHDDGVLMPSLRRSYDAIDGGHAWARRADLLRVSALAKFGGWYCDVDFLPFRPLSDLYDRYSNFPAGMFVTEFRDLVANGVIGWALNNDLGRLVLDELHRLAREPKKRAWDAYGPRLWTNLADPLGAAVHRGPMAMFYPFPDPAEAQARYLELQAENFSYDAIGRMFPSPAYAETPYMMHMGMEGRTNLVS